MTSATAILETSPLAIMPAWLAAGRAPPAAELRAQGFHLHGDPKPTELAAFVETWGSPSIPCAEVLRVLHRFQPLVDISPAGRPPYWTVLARNAGIDMGLGRLEDHPERNVFSNWPGEEILSAIPKMDLGRTLVLISNEADFNARPSRLLREALFGHCDLTSANDQLPQFPGYGDRLATWLRRPEDWLPASTGLILEP